MKTHRKRRDSRGFTLIELLAVVTIIVILATLTIGGLRYFHRKAAEDKARVQLKLLADALEKYKYDNGEYPLANQKEGKEQTEILWEKLYEEGTEDESGSIKVYVSSFDPASNNQGWLMKKGSTYMIIDPFGFEYRYRRMDSPAGMRNPDFDLWSVGSDGKTNPDNPKHRDNKDDIWD